MASEPREVKRDPLWVIAYYAPDGMQNRAAPDAITHAWGLTEAEWLDRVQSAVERAGLAEAELQAARWAVVEARTLLQVVPLNERYFQSQWIKDAASFMESTEQIATAARAFLDTEGTI